MTTLPKKTKRLYLRISEEDFNAIRKKSAPFSSMSAFVLQAINDYNDTSVRENLLFRTRLVEFYRQLDEKLGHLGGNLNQAMRRINECAKAGYPFDAIFVNEYLPRVEDLYILYTELRKELQELTRNTPRI